MLSDDTRFASQLAANDREHVKRLEEIAAALESLAKECQELTTRLYPIDCRIAAKAIRSELARWRRPHPMGER